MKRFVKKVLQKVALVSLEPALRETHDQRTSQILLALKYKEMGNNWEDYKEIIPDFEQIGFNVYSSTHEDGILLYIFSLIGTTNKLCVDIGASTVMGSNTANLIVNNGFSGLLIDRDSDSMKAAMEYYTKHRETMNTPPTFLRKRVTAENINVILENAQMSGEIDLLSIDIDGIDFWVWKAIHAIQPRVVIIEYQDILGPERSWAIPYKEDFDLRDYAVNRENHNYCGASLQAFVKLGKQKGYRLIGCNKGGWNAFFLKNGICETYFPEVSAESCFKPEWNQHDMETRFPLVKDMEWEEV